MLRLSQYTQTPQKLHRYLEEEGRLEIIRKSNIYFDVSFTLIYTEDNSTSKEMQAHFPSSPVLEA